MGHMGLQEAFIHFMFIFACMPLHIDAGNMNQKIKDPLRNHLEKLEKSMLKP